MLGSSVSRLTSSVSRPPPHVPPLTSWVAYHLVMAHVPAWERDPYLSELETEVLAAGVDGAGPFALLADSLFFPEGGGQPADHGRLGEVKVLDVRKVGDDQRHYLEAPVELGAIRLILDWDRRFDHMQQHTGQHLLSAIAEDSFGWATTAFHLGGHVCDVELAVPGLGVEQIESLEEAVAGEIRAARPVLTRRVAAGALGTLGVRTRGLPAGHVGDVRLVEIVGVDLNTCGGTHVRSTAELECLKLLHTEPMRGGTRLYFVAGRRARRRLAAHEERNAALRAALGVPDEEIAAAVAARLEELRTLGKSDRALQEELAYALADALARRPERLVEGHFEGHDLPFLQGLARQFSSQAEDKAAFLTAGTAAEPCFVLVVGGRAEADAQALGREAAALLGGRGGGSGRLFQGKAPSLAGRERVLDSLRASLG
jgi:alanyl-tRNA synthetase